MHILLTNDDGIYAPGLAALEHELRRFARVSLIAPLTEQSGVGHSITFLHPLICHEVYDGDQIRGWSVDGSPADCVKLGVFELCGGRPDLVVSGINSGLNAGINVLYSGTVAAAIEGAFFGIRSIAVSLEYDEHAPFDWAAGIAAQLVKQLAGRSEGTLFNINIPLSAQSGLPQVKCVPMSVARYGEQYLKRTDPRGRTYYWATGDPPHPATDQATDLSELKRGNITVTPLQYDMTWRPVLAEMGDWGLAVEGSPTRP